MSATQGRRPEWPSADFWELLDRLEGRHQRVLLNHDSARRRLEQPQTLEADELRRAWLDYCEVIAELDQSTAELEALRG